MMSAYQREFIQFALDLEVLKFGEFTLKSGRVSPYFFNAGLFNSGQSLVKLGKYYAEVLQANKVSNFMLYGPAYKGIPLATATAMSLASGYDIDVDYAFNRKEVKDHGEGGLIVGAPLKGDVIIVDDVITAGTSIRESFDIIKEHGANAKAVLIAVDRQEKLNDSEQSAIEQIQQTYNVPVYSIVTMNHLIEYVAQDEKYKHHLQSIVDYRDQYGT